MVGCRGGGEGHHRSPALKLNTRAPAAAGAPSAAPKGAVAARHAAGEGPAAPKAREPRVPPPRFAPLAPRRPADCMSPGATRHRNLHFLSRLAGLDSTFSGLCP